MLQDLGHRIRLKRERKGITLTAFAKELGVSPGYLSGLETGKKETITLQVLDKLQDSLSILPLKTDWDEDANRFEHLHQLYEKLQIINPEAATFLISTFENGVQYFLQIKKGE